MTEKSTKKMTTFDVPDSHVKVLKLKGYAIGQVLNSGSFSTVCKAKMNSKAVAVKVIDMKKSNKDYRKRFLPRELYVMTKLKHPNIITVHEICTVGDKVYVFMDLAEGGDVLDLVRDKKVDESYAKTLYRGLADALKYIHSKGFAHRDLKSENVLLNKERTVAKIADFGFSRACFDNKTGQRLLSDTYCGSAAYTAPEVLRLKPYNAMISDVWSMGVVLYVLINSCLPFDDSNLSQLLRQQIDNKMYFKPNLSAPCLELVRRQLDPNIKTRYTMEQVLQHQWLRQSDISAVKSV